MRFAAISAALVATVSAGGSGAYGYASSSTTCTEETYSTPAPVYSSTPAPVYYSSTPAAYTSAPVYSSSAPVYYSSSSVEEYSSTTCTEEYSSTPVPVYYSTTPVAYTSAPVYTTKTVTALTTYCPSATVITHGASTYTVTSATTLTITNCPCTVTEPVPVYTSTPAPAPVYTPPVYSNGTTVVTSGYAAPTGTSVSVPQYTGAASQLGAPAAGLAAVAGLAAYFL